MGFFNGERIAQNVFEPATLTKWILPKGVSGNAYNGVGQKEKSRPAAMFHGPEKHPWIRMMLYFQLRQHLGNGKVWGIKFRHAWRDKFGYVKQAETKVVKDPEVFSKEVCDFVRNHPEADDVGITRMKPEWMFLGQLEPKHPWVICIARGMDYEGLAGNLKGDFDPAVEQVIGGYERSQKAAVDLANHIREQGYSAKAYGGLTMIKGEWHTMIPPSIEAGLGELAKNGSMINNTLGSCFRIATVLTDMPLVADKPKNMGVDEFCKSCKKCQTDCPPGAISNEKQLVRGEVKWYVDFDKCMPFMAENKGCAICLSTCPWSRPGVAANLSEKMLRKLARQEEVSA